MFDPLESLQGGPHNNYTIIVKKVRFQCFLGDLVVCDRNRTCVQQCIMNETYVHGNSSCDCRWDEMFEVCADCRGMVICAFVCEHFKNVFCYSMHVNESCQQLILSFLQNSHILHHPLQLSSKVTLFTMGSFVKSLALQINVKQTEIIKSIWLNQPRDL